MRLWGWAEGPAGEIEAQEIMTFPGFRGQAKVVALSPDGSSLIAAGGKEREFGELRAYLAPRAAPARRR